MTLRSADNRCCFGHHVNTTAGKDVFLYKKASSYIVQYPVLRTVQSALHCTSLTDLFTQALSRLLWEASSHMLQLLREGCSYTYPPLRYSFIQLSELAQGFNTATQDSNPGSRSRESEALLLSHCALLISTYSAVSNPQDCPKRGPVQSNTISTSLGGIQPR